MWPPAYIYVGLEGIKLKSVIHKLELKITFNYDLITQAIQNMQCNYING